MKNSKKKIAYAVNDISKKHGWTKKGKAPKGANRKVKAGK